MHSPSSPGLYGGFAQAVASQSARSIGDAPLPTEDWYVGIGGVPLGPVRLSVLRDKATQGQVDSDSLVWREGLDEWQAIKNFPGLMAVVEEARHQRTSRTSAATPPPVASSSPLPSSGHSQSQTGRAAASALAAASSIPLQVPEAAVSHPFDLVRQSQPPFGAYAPPPAPSDPGPQRDANLPLMMPDPFGASVPGANGVNGSSSPYGLTTTAAISQDAGRVSLPPASIPPAKKKGVHPIVWAFVAMAAVFGGVAAWAIFVRAPAVVYVPQGTAATVATNMPAPPAPPDATNTGEATATTTEAVALVSGVHTPTWGPKGAPTGSAKPGETVAPLDTSKFGGPTGPTSPGTGGPSTTSGGGGGPLSEGEANGVVASNTPRVRRKCWDSVSGARSADAPKSVRVNVSIVVAPSGKVTSAGASGGNEKHYPGLTSCVQSTVSGWSFPPSGEGGKFSVPFNFSVQ